MNRAFAGAATPFEPGPHAETGQPTAGGRQWPAAQAQAIHTTNRGVLVSAAAGSGKTATLAARVAHLICDDKLRCAAEQVLVVTFTESAAAEMRARIDTALHDAARLHDSEHAQRQLLLAGRA